MADVAPPRPLAKMAALPAYKPGKSAEATMAEHGLDRAAKLSSNENPFGPLPSVVDAITRAARDTNRYPDSNATEVKAAIADRLGVTVDRVTVGPGSSGILLQALCSYAGPGDEVLFGWRSFEAYPIYTRTMGATDVPVALRGFDLDVDAIADAVNERTRMVMLANPNNPTGTVIAPDALRRFLDRVPSDVLVVLDEAYGEFVHPGATCDGVVDFADRPNVLVSRTLSKAYGLAGLRIGYGVGHPEVVGNLDKVRAPFAIPTVTQAATLASFAASAELAERVALLNRERDRVVAAVRSMGLPIPDSHANLVWLPCGEATASLFDALERRGVVTRAFHPEGLRISIGAPEDNDLFLRVLADAVEPLRLREQWVHFDASGAARVGLA